MKIRFHILTVFFMLLSASCIKAQAFEKDRLNISLGHGVNVFEREVFMRWGDIYSALGPLHFRAGIGLNKTIEFGTSVNYAQLKIDRATHDLLSAMARITVHGRSKNTRFDPYFAVSGGWRFFIGENDRMDIPFGFEMVLGGRYFFSRSIGFYSELGIAKSIFQGGIVIKLL